MFWIILAAIALLIFITVTLFSSRNGSSQESFEREKNPSFSSFAMEAGEEFVEVDKVLEVCPEAEVVDKTLEK